MSSYVINWKKIQKAEKIFLKKVGVVGFHVVRKLKYETSLSLTASFPPLFQKEP